MACNSCKSKECELVDIIREGVKGEGEKDYVVSRKSWWIVRELRLVMAAQNRKSPR